MEEQFNSSAMRVPLKNVKAARPRLLDSCKSFMQEARYATVVALVAKVVVGAALVVGFYAGSDFESVPNLWNRWYTGPDDLASWYIPFSNWDGQYYLLLSDWGYNYDQTTDSPRAFFPLYPLLIRALSYVMPRMVAATLLSVLLTAGLGFFLLRLAAHFGCRDRHLVILFTLSFPTAFFASVFYSEALFMFLQLGFVYHLMVTRSWKAWIYAGLLPLTRGTALFVVVGALAFFVLLHVRYKRATNEHSRTPTSKDTESVASTRSDAVHLDYHYGCAYAFLVGGLLYLVYFSVTTGDPLAGIHAQATFGLNSISNLLDPRHFATYLLSETSSWFGARESLFNKISVIAAMLCVLIFVAYREWPLLCFYVPLVYGQAAMGMGVSFPRFFLVAVPFLALAIAKNVKYSWPVYAICAAMCALQLYLLNHFGLNFWIA